MREIRIDAPGAGEWIMRQSEGAFHPGVDHSFSTHRNGDLLGGFVTIGALGRSITIHDAGQSRDWCTRDLLWMVFHYAFCQLGCTKVIAPVASDNHRALALNLRAGFRLEAVIRDAVAPQRHLMLLTMGVAECRWLGIIPQSYFPGDVVTGLARHG